MKEETKETSSIPHLENELDFNLWRSSTSARDDLGFLEQSKDLIHSNLKEDEISLARDTIELIGLSEFFLLKRCFSLFTRRLAGIVNTARARDGFERINQISQRIHQDHNIKEQNRSRFWRRDK